VLLAACACASALVVAPAALAAPTAYWRLSTSSAPAQLAPGKKGEIIVTASNPGDAENDPTKSTPITIADNLPAGLTATAISGYVGSAPFEKLTCSPATAKPLTCTDTSFTLLPATSLRIVITVEVGAGLPVGSTLTNEATETGGQAPPPPASREPVLIGEHEAFGVEKYELRPEEEGGITNTQAGSHPFQLSTAISLNLNAREEPVALPKDLQFTLPPGLIGNPIAIPQCRQADFNTITEGPANLCPPDTAVGIAEVTIDEPAAAPVPDVQTVPVFNIEPAAGEPARLGFSVFKVPVVLSTSVRTGSDYAVVVTAKRSSETAGLLSSRVEVWGVPGDPRHNSERGWECAGGGQHRPEFLPLCSEQKQPPEVPFLSLPTSCTALHSPMQALSWAPGAVPTEPRESEFPISLTGCNLLQFTPFLREMTEEGKKELPGVQPTETSASTPTGLGVHVEMPQRETPTGLAQAAVKSTTVTLPEGMQLNPAAANALQACSAFEVGLAPGFEEPAQTENNHFTADPPSCQNAAKVGTVSIKSPDLRKPLTGFAYLSREHTSPFEAPLVIYLLAEEEDSHVRVKLAGKVTPLEGSGRLVSTFENTPQVPFEKLDVNFFSGPRASVSTPALCGSYTTTSAFTPWSGNEPATPETSFAVTSGPGGGPCPNNPLPFAPSLNAGSVNTQAGAFTPFTVTIGNPDGDQALQGLTMHLPPGLAAMLSSVTPCQEPQAARNECGPESLIGHSLASSGLGGEPVTLPGSVYLTGPYKGAPFGLSVVTPAVTGPFNLGNVTVRSTINVDRSTAAVTVTSDPFPTMLKGVPVQLKQINVAVDRPNFQFNGTNCNPMSITGALGGAQGASASFSYPYKANNCASLPFAPKLTASVSGQSSKANGVTFDVKVESGGLGVASPAKVNLQLPIELPSRLTTIQQACRDTVFEVNPAACDEGSVIGSATIHTPVLKNPLTGPAYLVSHGNASFPDVEFLLQGEGLTILLDGKTDIKKGITYSRFESNPDAPFTVFETELPAGPHSALGDFLPASKNHNLCGTTLLMPTELQGQNGALITQTTKVAIKGCKEVKKFKASRATLLARALKACRKLKSKHKRIACERAARKKYGPHKKPAHHKHK
jgi:hypothetical protein